MSSEAKIKLRQLKRLTEHLEYLEQVVKVNRHSPKGYETLVVVEMSAIKDAVQWLEQIEPPMTDEEMTFLKTLTNKKLAATKSINMLYTIRKRIERELR